MSSYKSDGNSVDVTAGGSVAAYSLQSVGGSGATALVGVAQGAAESGDVYTLAISGEHWVAKTAAQAWAVGDPVYLSAGAATTTKSTNPLIGVVSEAALSAATEGAVILTPGGLA